MTDVCLSGVFEMFYEQHTTEYHGGRALGLPLCRNFSVLNCVGTPKHSYGRRY